MQVVAEYDYYTLDQAREIIKAEEEHKKKLRAARAKICRAIKRKKKRESRIRHFQGAAIMACGVALCAVGCWDGAFFVVAGLLRFFIA